MATSSSPAWIAATRTDPDVLPASALTWPPTPAGILLNARKIALANGVRYAYVGNVHNKQASSSYCHACGQLLIGRDWHQLSEWRLDANGCCQNCGAAFAGRFNPQPGTWGAKRQALTFG